MEMLFKLPKNTKYKKIINALMRSHDVICSQYLSPTPSGMRKVIVLTLEVIFILTFSQALKVIKKIDLMRRIGTIVVEKSTNLTPIAITILTGKNDDPLEKWLSDKLKTVLSMPGILNLEKKRILSNYAERSIYSGHIQI
jgi:hypothetical protein